MNFNLRIFQPLSTALVITFLAVATPQAQTNSQQSGEQPLVKLNVLVTDASKRPVKDVRQEEFRVFENGVPALL